MIEMVSNGLATLEVRGFYEFFVLLAKIAFLSFCMEISSVGFHVNNNSCSLRSVGEPPVAYACLNLQFSS